MYIFLDLRMIFLSDLLVVRSNIMVYLRLVSVYTVVREIFYTYRCLYHKLRIVHDKTFFSWSHSWTLTFSHPSFHCYLSVFMHYRVRPVSKCWCLPHIPNNLLFSTLDPSIPKR